MSCLLGDPGPRQTKWFYQKSTAIILGMKNQQNPTTSEAPRTSKMRTDGNVLLASVCARSGVDLNARNLGNISALTILYSFKIHSDFIENIHFSDTLTINF